jgi:hypothetical protein
LIDFDMTTRGDRVEIVVLDNPIGGDERGEIFQPLFWRLRPRPRYLRRRARLSIFNILGQRRLDDPQSGRDDKRGLPGAAR